MNDTTEQPQAKWVDCPTCGQGLMDNGSIIFCPKCHMGIAEQMALPSTATPTPALRWKVQYRQIERAAGIETRTLQQLWLIRENGAIRQEWRCVEEVQADVSDSVA